MEIATDIIEKREKLTPKVIDNLYIAVHPSFLVTLPSGEFCAPYDVSADYFEAMRQTQQRMLTYFTPHEPDDVLVVMPLKLKRGERRAEARGEITWAGFFKKATATSSYPQNVILAKDFHHSFLEDNPSMVEVARKEIEEKLVGRLEEKGWAIDESTNIILGGERLDQCELTTLLKLFLLPQVRKVTLDRGASVPSAYQDDPKYYDVMAQEEKNYLRLLDSLREKFRVEEDPAKKFVLISQRDLPAVN